MRRDPSQRGKRIIICYWERVFWCEPVFDRNDDGIGESDERSDVSLSDYVESRSDAEPSAVVVNEKRQSVR